MKTKQIKSFVPEVSRVVQELGDSFRDLEPEFDILLKEYAAGETGVHEVLGGFAAIFVDWLPSEHSSYAYSLSEIPQVKFLYPLADVVGVLMGHADFEVEEEGADIEDHLFEDIFVKLYVVPLLNGGRKSKGEALNGLLSNPVYQSLNRNVSYARRNARDMWAAIELGLHIKKPPFD